MRVYIYMALIDVSLLQKQVKEEVRYILMSINSVMFKRFRLYYVTTVNRNSLTLVLEVNKNQSVQDHIYGIREGRGLWRTGQ